MTCNMSRVISRSSPLLTPPTGNLLRPEGGIHLPQYPPGSTVSAQPINLFPFKKLIRELPHPAGAAKFLSLGTEGWRSSALAGRQLSAKIPGAHGCI